MSVSLLTDDVPAKPLAHVAIRACRIKDDGAREDATAGNFTDKNGLAELSPPENGKYVIQCDPYVFEGERSGELANYSPPTPFEKLVDVGSEALKLNFVAKRGFTLKVRILTDDGRPMSGEIPPIGADGRFQRRGLAAGRDFAVLLLPSQAHSKYYYGRVIRIPAADAKRGAVVDLGDVRWPPMAGTINLRGTAHTADGKLSSGAYIRLIWSADGSTALPITIQNGKFEAALPRGKYGIFNFTDVDDYLRHPADKALANFEVTENAVTKVDIELPTPKMEYPSTRQQ